MPFLGQIHTSLLLSRPMGPIGRAHPPPFPPMGDSDGFNAVPQMASMGPPPVLSSLWTGGASPDSRGDYYDGPHKDLLGFILSLAALLKKTVEELVFQIRLHLVI
ncbi:uncharacterized protein LOC113566973 [Drosophila persimilis]|uniref:uncharacterized protein LOC113566973 n=1 Tax=Drosophila persimilis TaxID=7234 RepID=UPI000F096B77|nr:uncharacterized protein LOC113566973 [Drosophila persimilis]